MTKITAVEPSTVVMCRQPSPMMVWIEVPKPSAPIASSSPQVEASTSTILIGAFLRLSDAEQIAGAGNENEKIVAEHDEPGRKVAGEPRAAGALHDIERRADQYVAAEGEDHRRGVQRTQPPEGGPRQIEIESEMPARWRYRDRR